MTKKIMIVDDSASIRQVAKMTLLAEGYEVIDACDGLDAINKLDEGKINLIISDLNMPNMDGLSLLKKVKEMGQYRFTPFLMLTTESGSDFVSQGKQAGAKAWMIKPFKPEKLINTVSRILA